jgi:hypothetical protein
MLARSPSVKGEPREFDVALEFGKRSDDESELVLVSRSPTYGVDHVDAAEERPRGYCMCVGGHSKPDFSAL